MATTTDERFEQISQGREKSSWWPTERTKSIFRIEDLAGCAATLELRVEESENGKEGKLSSGGTECRIP
jgi:hypothetical protein